MEKINVFITKSRLIILLFLSFGSSAYAQIGINTGNPLAKLHIDGGKDNPSTGAPNASQSSNDLVVTNAGFVGVGVLNPIVKLDLRSSGTQNAIGLGNTTMTAATAGAGAVRYEATTSRIQVSDGNVWEAALVLPTKAVVVARMTAAFSVAYNTDVNITGWDEVRDLSSSFDPATGIFTAPRDGVYTFLLTYNFVSGTVANSSEVTSQFYSPSANSILARSFKTFARGNEAAQVGGSSTITVRLTANQTVRPQLRQNITGAGARSLRNNSDWTNPDAGFNNLTIIEH
ncbi:complement C1q domain-containing protein [Chryseobacterium oryctis]|uniref:Complement C1q domain-containing protein n=1 Tax=Chryseobacterium oryctis TaxID=2952618 RepID=A0ABT3HL60_9FLAO|nr:complement C1q domain-containing protein [Chryseobacterium oryctis]MCW3160516.1 complement C1q domain-containing protein [Chryseobacterium oryctis]